ncbi:hypothetical protein [Lentzea sp. NPDC059081]|uniref:hypothetical protein n=1 Tax=Lentzea sp. NPDC059081 TaxID=3346719 RepID=UPI00369B7782
MMATIPKWQQPLVERAAAADEQLRTAMLTAGGGQGAMRAVVWGHRELAEIAHLLADRQTSPLVSELLRHGARALKTQADGYEQAVLNYADQAADDEAPVWSTLDYSDDADEVDDGQALAEVATAPAETSDDARTSEPTMDSSQASPDDRSVAQAIALHGVHNDRSRLIERGRALGLSESTLLLDIEDLREVVDNLDGAPEAEDVDKPSLAQRIREFGDRERDQARTKAAAWTAWANELNRLMLRWPGRTLVRVMDDCGDVGQVELGVDHLDNLAMTTALQQLRSQGDALAAAYSRAADAVDTATAETLQELWVNRGGES